MKYKDEEREHRAVGEDRGDRGEGAERLSRLDGRAVSTSGGFPMAQSSTPLFEVQFTDRDLKLCHPVVYFR